MPPPPARITGIVMLQAQLSTGVSVLQSSTVLISTSVSSPTSEERTGVCRALPRALIIATARAGLPAIPTLGPSSGNIIMACDH